MNQNIFCQSCGLPMNTTDLHGTEKDGSVSAEYCKHCYDKGVFTHPAMTLAEMRDHIKIVMEKGKVTADLVEAALTRLPRLKRWTSKHPKRKKEIPAMTSETPSEKHPLERAPAPGPLAQSEEELDIIIDEDPGEMPGTEIPEPGEGP